jgi:hypothetical protein
MTVTKEAGHGDKAAEAGDTTGAVQYVERAKYFLWNGTPGGLG